MKQIHVVRLLTDFWKVLSGFLVDSLHPNGRSRRSTKNIFSGLASCGTKHRGLTLFLFKQVSPWPLVLLF